MNILRKYWSADETDRVFIIITDDGQHSEMTLEEARELFKECTEILRQLYPLLAKDSVDTYMPDDN